MSRLLLLRAVPPDEEGALPPDVDLLVTHEAVPLGAGVAEALAAEASGSCLAVTSRTTVRVLVESGAAGLLARAFDELLAAGSGTARAMLKAGAAAVTVPEAPGAAGIVAALERRLPSLRLLWPHGADADPAPFVSLGERGARLLAPVVYDKRPRPAVPAEVLERLASGETAAVAVASLAALDVLLGAFRSAALPVPPVRWGVLGPATSRGLAARGLGQPAVPSRPSLDDLIELLRREVNR